MDDVYNITNSEYESLFDLYNSTLGLYWVWSDGPGIPWNFTHYDNPCLDFWQGITCSELPEDGYLHIIELDLTNHNVDGTLPESIGNLFYLRNLSLSDNELYAGTIPDSIGMLVQLRSLVMHETFINGTIPDSFGNLTELVTLDLGNNNLFGTIPHDLCNLKQLVGLDLSANVLKGAIPDCFGSFSHLLYLNLYLNDLNGPIPASLGNLTNLLLFELYDNYLTGSIPDALSTLTNLLEFDCGQNHLTGTIPLWVGGMSDLSSLGLNENEMNGTIPKEIGNLQHLVAFYAYDNDFTGTLPLTLSNLVNLLFLDVADNRLSGPFPHYLGNFLNLQYLTLFDNHLTGTFPTDIGRATGLVEVNIGANRIEGPLPNELWNCSTLVAFVVSNNRFTSTVPECLLNLPFLHIIEMGLNHLTGHLPDGPFLSPIASFYSVGYNHLTGTIPASFSNVENLVYLNLSFNYLTSTIPEVITSLVKLNFLYLSSNLLTGPLPRHWESMPVLSYVFMSQNFLSGTIPSSFGFAELLISLNLSHNHLTGTIPVEFAFLPDLQVLLLQDNMLVGNIYGVLNGSFQQNLSTVQFSNNQLTGTLPDQLFLSNTLTVFAAVSNCFTGSIPLTLCNSSSINTLALDGLQSATSCRRTLFPASLNGIVAQNLYIISNPFFGGVPGCLFSMPQLTTLHLSGNGLTGSISEDIFISPTLTDLSLSHNKITGSIPIVLLNRPWTNLDLSYNVFKHTLSDEGRAVYARNASIYLEQNRLSGKIPDMFTDVRSISVLESNLFACNTGGDDLPPHDPNIDKYQCGSNTLNETLYAWLVTAFVLAIGTLGSWWWRDEFENWSKIRIESLFEWWHHAYGRPELVHYMEVTAVTEVILYVSIVCTMWCICVLMPTFIALSFTYGSYTHQYAWTLSAAYLSGKVPFALEFTFLLLLVVICYIVFRMHTGVVSGGKITEISSGFGASPTASIKRRVVVYSCYILLTFALVLGVNIAYVVVALNENGSALTAAQIALALFKVGFNSLCSPLLLRWVSHHGLDDSGSRDFVSIQLIVGLVNNIAIPCFVVAIISPRCFYDIFEATDSVQSSYNYNGRCLEYNTDSTKIVTCRQEQILSATTSYDPPFEYSYQCSSSFITYYAPAYVIMCILAGVAIPVVQVALQLLHSRAAPGTRWFALLDLVMPRILKPLHTDSSRSMFVLYLDAQQHLTTLLNYLGLLLTFGAVFPPLAICFLATMVSIAAFARLRVGRFLHVSGEESAAGCVQIINTACVGAGNLVKLQHAVLTVLVFSCIFYTLFLFDTLGDSVGFFGAYWVLIVVPLIPISLSFDLASALVAKNLQPGYVVNTVTSPRRAERSEFASDVELQCAQNWTVQNPISNFNVP